MADDSTLAASYGAEGGGSDEGKSWLEREATDLWEGGKALVKGAVDTVGDIGGAISDFAEKTFQNELEDQGIADVRKYEDYMRDSLAWDEETKAAKFQQMVDEGVIGDKLKYDTYQAKQKAELSDEEKSVTEDIGQKREKFRESAMQAFKDAGVLSDADTSSPEARRLLDGINEVAADYVMNYSKIASDDGSLDKDAWNKQFQQYESDMLAFMKQWAVNVKNGMDDQQAYDEATKNNEELLQRVKKFDRDLTIESLSSPISKYWDKVTSDEEENKGFVKTGTNAVKAGLAALSTGFGYLEETVKRADVGVTDVQGLEELQHTDNKLIDEIWESAPEILSTVIPMLLSGGLSSAGKLAMAASRGRTVAAEAGAAATAAKTSRLAEYFKGFGAEMGEDFLIWDPYVQALIGSGFKEEDFAVNTGGNLLFNGLIALKAKGADRALPKALTDVDTKNVDPGKFGITGDEMKAIENGEIEKAQLMIASRIVNGTDEVVTDLRVLAPEKADSAKAIIDTTAKTVEDAKNGLQTGKFGNQIESVLAYGKGLNAKEADRVLELSNVAGKAESLLENGDPKALTMYNMILINEARKRGGIDTELEKSLTQKINSFVKNTPADEMAQDRFVALMKGETPPPIEAAMESAVLAKTRDLSQFVVNEGLVKTGKLPDGARAYGVYSKLPNGTFRNVKSGEILDAQSVANISDNFKVSTIPNAKSILGELSERESKNFESETKFEFETKPDAQAKPEGYWADTFKSVLDSPNPETITVDQYRSIKLALKNALVARHKYMKPKADQAQIAKAIEQSPVLSMWKFDAKTQTYSINAEGLKLPPDLAPALAKRINRAMKVMDPHAFVSNFETAILQGRFISDPSLAESLAKKAQEIGIDAGVVKAVAAAVEEAQKGTTKAEQIAKALFGKEALRLPKSQMDDAKAAFAQGIDNTGWHRADEFSDLNGKQRSVLQLSKNPASSKDAEALDALLEKIPDSKKSHVPIHKKEDGYVWTNQAVFDRMNPELLKAVKTLNKTPGAEMYVLQPFAREGSYGSRFERVVGVSEKYGALETGSWIGAVSAHVPVVVIMKDGKIVKAVDMHAAYGGGSDKWKKTQEEKRFDMEGHPTMQAVQRLGKETDKEFDWKKPFADDEAFKSDFEYFWKKYGAGVRIARVSEKSWDNFVETEHRGNPELKKASGYYDTKRKAIYLVDNESVEVFLHEFSHHLEKELEELYPQTHANIKNWYEQLFRGMKNENGGAKYANFHEFFAEFMSDAFIRRKDYVANNVIKYGLTNSKEYDSVIQSVLKIFRKAVYQLYKLIAGKADANIREFKEAEKSQSYFKNITFPGAKPPTNLKKYEDVLKGGKNPIDEETAIASTNAFFDIMLEELKAVTKLNKAETLDVTDFYAKVMSPMILGKISGKPLNQTDMLSRFMAQLSQVVWSGKVEEMVKGIKSEEKKKSFVSNILKLIIKRNIEFKKTRVQDATGKYVDEYAPVSDKNFDMQIGMFADFLSAARPMFELVSKEGFIWSRSKEFASALTEAFLKANNKFNNPQFVYPQFSKLLKEAEENFAKNEKSLTDLEKEYVEKAEYFKWYFASRSRLSRMKEVIFEERTTAKGAEQRDLEDLEKRWLASMKTGLDQSMFEAQYVNAMQDKASLAREIETIADRVKEKADYYLEEAISLAFESKISNPEIIDSLILYATVFKKNAKGIVRANITKSTKDYRTYLNTLLNSEEARGGYDVVRRLRKSMEFAELMQKEFKIPIVKETELPDSRKFIEPDSVVDELSPEKVKSVIVGDDVFAGNLSRDGTAYETFGEKHPVTSAFKFNEKKIPKGAKIVVPKNVILRIFAEEHETLSNLKEFIIKNPDRIIIAPVDVFMDGTKAVIKKIPENSDAQKGMFRKFERETYVPSDYKISLEAANASIRRLLPPGINGFNWATEIRHGLQSLAMAFNPNAYAEEIRRFGNKELKDIRNVNEMRKQFKKIKNALLGEKKDVTISAKNVLASLGILGKCGDLYSVIFNDAIINKVIDNKKVPLLSVSLPTNFKSITKKAGEMERPDLFASKYVVYQMLVSMSKEVESDSEMAAKWVTDKLAEFNRKIDEGEMVEKEIAMSLGKDVEAMGLFIKVLRKYTEGILGEGSARVSDSEIIDYLLSPNGRGMRNLLRNVFENVTLRGGNYDSSYFMKAAESVEVKVGRKGNEITYRGTEGDQAEDATKVIEAFLEGVTEGRYSASKKIEGFADEGEFEGDAFEKIDAEKEVDSILTVPAEEILERWGRMMRLYVDDVKKSLRFGEIPEFKSSEQMHEGMTFNATLLRNADFENNKLSEFKNKAEYYEFFKGTRIYAETETVRSVMKMFDAYGTPEDIAKLEENGFEIRFEIPDETKEFFRNELKFTDEEIENLFPKNASEVFKDPEKIIAFVASVAAYTKHGNVKKADLDKLAEEGGGTMELGNRKLSYKLFDLVVSHEGKSAKVSYATNNFHLNPLVRNYIRATGKALEMSDEEIAFALKQGPFDTLQIAYEMQARMYARNVMAPSKEATNVVKITAEIESAKKLIKDNEDGINSLRQTYSDYLKDELSEESRLELEKDAEKYGLTVTEFIANEAQRLKTEIKNADDDIVVLEKRRQDASLSATFRAVRSFMVDKGLVEDLGQSGFKPVKTAYVISDLEKVLESYSSGFVPRVVQVKGTNGKLVTYEYVRAGARSHELQEKFDTNKKIEQSLNKKGEENFAKRRGLSKELAPLEKEKTDLILQKKKVPNWLEEKIDSIKEEIETLRQEFNEIRLEKIENYKNFDKRVEYGLQQEILKKQILYSVSDYKRIPVKEKADVEFMKTLAENLEGIIESLEKKSEDTETYPYSMIAPAFQALNITDVEIPKDGMRVSRFLEILDREIIRTGESEVADEALIQKRMNLFALKKRVQKNSKGKKELNAYEIDEMFKNYNELIENYVTTRIEKTEGAEKPDVALDKMRKTLVGLKQLADSKPRGNKELKGIIEKARKDYNNLLKKYAYTRAQKTEGAEKPDLSYFQPIDSKRYESGYYDTFKSETETGESVESLRYDPFTGEKLDSETAAEVEAFAAEQSKLQAESVRFATNYQSLLKRFSVPETTVDGLPMSRFYSAAKSEMSQAQPETVKYVDLTDEQLMEIHKRFSENIEDPAGGYALDVLKAREEYRASSERLVTKAERTVANKNVTSISDLTNHSGGALGSDTLWNKIGIEEYGVLKHQNYYAVKKSNKLMNAEMPAELIPEGRKFMLEVGHELGTIDSKFKNALNPNEPVGQLIIRNYMQVKNADAVYAIVEGIVKKGDDIVNADGSVRGKANVTQVKGGTAYAVAGAQKMGKPAFVFDVTTGKWYDSEFKEISKESVLLTPDFAGVGSRLKESSKETKAKAVNAIRKAYANTLAAINDGTYYNKLSVLMRTQEPLTVAQKQEKEYVSALRSIGYEDVDGVIRKRAEEIAIRQQTLTIAGEATDMACKLDFNQ